LKVLIIEPYYTGSHKYWVDNVTSHSKHDIAILTMPGRHWKWRIKGSAITFAQKVNNLKERPSLIICSSLMDLSLFKSLLASELTGIPIVYYMHENQLTYPYSNNETRSQEDFHYGFSNYTSCLVADQVFFNSLFHKTQFLSAIMSLLKRLPDYTDKCIELAKSIEAKSEVIYVGLNFERIDSFKNKIQKSTPPTLLWNHRWSHDKRPDLFLRLCQYLRDKQVDFKLNLLNNVDSDNTGVYKLIKDEFEEYIVLEGLISDYDKYIKAISSSDILPVSSDHDFYGISVLEAIYCGLCPILPRNKVYEEFFDSNLYSENYYETEQEFFEKTLNKIFNRQFVIDKDDIVKIHSIHNVMNQFDLCIMNYHNI